MKILYVERSKNVRKAIFLLFLPLVVLSIPGRAQLFVPEHDFRWNFCNRMLTPYLGLSAGMEMADDPLSPRSAVRRAHSGAQYRVKLLAAI